MKRYVLVIIIWKLFCWIKNYHLKIMHRGKSTQTLTVSFMDDIFRYIFLNEDVYTSTKFHQICLLRPNWRSVAVGLSNDLWSRLLIKCGMKLLIHSQTSTVQPLKFGNGQLISHHTLRACDCLSMLGSKSNHVVKRHPWYRAVIHAYSNLIRGHIDNSTVNNI